MSNTGTETVSVTLRRPIEINGKPCSVLTFREPEVGDVITAETVGGGQMAQTVATLALMAEVPLQAFRKITARDLNRIIAATDPLLGNDDDATDGATAPS
ncbi:phage tail assembly protein [Aurantimonas sp. MSK8Z-1]|uniref:phage tail assembly protein n=1 Tax=Mangrovibrevibacter kandeliae TaxID=2968473 RepID=UPI0021195EE0|nr:phage tail assembly protein [Aurantimonas sp. MSK8Z-1]MCW4114733.1 phage tail assembly protein [Aurantimonas sp. MSK8Z-1]